MTLTKHVSSSFLKIKVLFTVTDEHLLSVLVVSPSAGDSALNLLYYSTHPPDVTIFQSNCNHWCAAITFRSCLCFYLLVRWAFVLFCAGIMKSTKNLELKQTLKYLIV